MFCKSDDRCAAMTLVPKVLKETLAMTSSTVTASGSRMRPFMLNTAATTGFSDASSVFQTAGGKFTFA